VLVLLYLGLENWPKIPFARAQGELLCSFARGSLGYLTPMFTFISKGVWKNSKGG